MPGSSAAQDGATWGVPRLRRGALMAGRILFAWPCHPFRPSFFNTCPMPKKTAPPTEVAAVSKVAKAVKATAETKPEKQPKAAPSPQFSLPSDSVGDGRVRAVVDAVLPAVDAGRFPVKCVAGDTVHVTAHCFTDGHDVVRAMLCWSADAGDGA